jgi:cytochrome P450
MEMRTVIGEVLRHVELHAADPADEAARLRHVTLVPGDLTRVVARPAPGVEKSLAASGAAASA